MMFILKGFRLYDRHQPTSGIIRPKKIPLALYVFPTLYFRYFRKKENRLENMFFLLQSLADVSRIYTDKTWNRIH